MGSRTCIADKRRRLCNPNDSWNDVYNNLSNKAANQRIFQQEAFTILKCTVY